MSIDTDGLQAFVRIAELGSFGQAADALFISAPALSHRISKLEQNLGVRLLDRTTRTVRLTSVGREFLPQGRRLLDELERSISSLRDAAKHEERASCPAKHIGKIHRQHCRTAFHAAVRRWRWLRRKRKA